jgi:hypothetical protein
LLVASPAAGLIVKFARSPPMPEIAAELRPSFANSANFTLDDPELSTRMFSPRTTTGTSPYQEV